MSQQTPISTGRLISLPVFLYQLQNTGSKIVLQHIGDVMSPSGLPDKFQSRIIISYGSYVETMKSIKAPSLSLLSGASTKLKPSSKKSYAPYSSNQRIKLSLRFTKAISISLVCNTVGMIGHPQSQTSVLPQPQKPRLTVSSSAFSSYGVMD